MTPSSIYMRIMIWRWKLCLNWHMHPISFILSTLFK